MHIALYSPSWPPAGAANGVVSYVATIRDYLIGEGQEVSILSEGHLYPSDGSDMRLLAPIEELHGQDKLRRRISRRLDQWHGGLPGLGRLLADQVAEAHRIHPIDVFEMEESFGWSHTVQKFTRVPVVTRLHGPHFLKPIKPRTIREKLGDLQRSQTEGRAIRSSRTLTAPIRSVMKLTCDHYQRRPQGRDSVIPNPIRLIPEAKQWRLSDCDRNRILMIGRFDYWKGADTLLLAFEKLLRGHPDARLTLVGPVIGIEKGPGQLADFEEYARANLSPETARRVEITGTLTHAEIARLRQEAFVTVVSSRLESFSYALVEGLAAGSPMVSTDWVGSDEIIEHGVTGFLTPVGDPDAMAQRLGWMLDHPEVAARIGENGARHCAVRFSVETVGIQLIECYQATVGNGTG